jgi:hypothetical protein
MWRMNVTRDALNPMASWQEMSTVMDSPGSGDLGPAPFARID